jgi:phytoene dehydrogenase-like protein
MKKVIIVGAGIAGLSAGIYAQRSGFNVTIFEMHNIPGGNSTSWKRGGYFFEGGMHWLTGSSEKTPLNRLWKETGALEKETPIYNKDPFSTVEYNGERICLYRDPEKTKNHFLLISPDDHKEIKALCKDVHKFSKMNMPITDIKGLRVRQKSPVPLSMFFNLLPLIPRMIAFNKISCGEYAQQFRHKGIRMLLENVVGADYSAMSLFFTLGCLASGDGGYPEGGSLKMAMRMAKKFESLGGNIRYNSRVEKIHRNAGNAVDGIYIDDTFIPADAVIVSSDTLSSDKFFDPPLLEPWMDDMRKNTCLLSCTFAGLGIKAGLSHLPENIIFPLKRPFTFAGTGVSELGINNYASYKGYAPEGCTAFTIILSGDDTYDCWKGYKADGSYNQKKEELAYTIIDRISEQFPEIQGKIEVWDVATPLTYERYCGTFRGSWMTITEKNKQAKAYPCKSKEIGNLYFAGQRIQAPGGLPIAVLTGRQAVQYLCLDTGTVFENNM